MNTDAIKTRYLGDGVYANAGNYRGEIILTTGCHIAECHGRVPDNAIYLDPETSRGLYLYLQRIFETTPTENTQTL